MGRYKIVNPTGIYFTTHTLVGWLPVEVLISNSRILLRNGENQMIETEIESVEITAVQYRAGYKLDVTFSDGKEQIVDFGPFLQKSQHCGVQKYLDIGLFKKFTFEFGHLHWNDYDLSFSIDDLYNDQIL